MISISLCMIVKNEQENLGECLASISGVADEIVIVDTGSIDDTKNVARRFTDNIYDFAWIDDFAAARNFAFSKANMDYILWLDADDRLLDEDRQRFIELKSTLPAHVDAVMMRYHVAFDATGRSTFSYYRGRLVRRAGGFLWHEPVHEYLAVGGQTIHSDIAVTHAKRHDQPASDRNLRIYESILARGEALSPRGQFYYARELKDHGRLQSAIAAYESFLGGAQGWVENNVSACLDLGDLHLALGEPQAALRAFLWSFSLDTPRAEACCRLGYLFKNQRRFQLAAFWFELAQSLTKPQQCLGFLSDDDWDYVPRLELAVCHYQLGDIKKARHFNELAAQSKPESPQVAHNRALFEGLLRE